MIISPNICSSVCLPKNEHLFKTFQALGVLTKRIYRQQLTWVMSVGDCRSSIFFSSLIISKKSQLISGWCCQHILLAASVYWVMDIIVIIKVILVIVILLLLIITIIIIVIVKNGFNNNIINQKRNWHWWELKSNLIRSNQFKVWLLVRWKKFQ